MIHTDDNVVYGLGLLLSSIAKHANHSNNPSTRLPLICHDSSLTYPAVWPFVHGASGGYNKTGLALACLAIYDFYTRRNNPAVSERQEEVKSASVAPLPARKHSILSGFTLGCLIFTLHCFVADSGTLIAWSWTGYPLKGPLPNLHGSLTHVAQAFGLLLPILTLNSGSPDFLSHPLWFAYGCAGAYVTYAFRDWPGYIGGMNFAVFLMSIIPLVLGHAARNGHIARTYTIAMLTTALFDVINTFTVAYAFVPGGEYLRERTDL